MVAMSCASSGWVFSSISGTRVKAPPFSAVDSVRLERQLGPWLGAEQHAPELGLDALEALPVVGLEAQHHHGSGVRGAREAEAVWIFDAQAVELDHLGRAGKGGALLQ